MFGSGVKIGMMTATTRAAQRIIRKVQIAVGTTRSAAVRTTTAPRRGTFGRPAGADSFPAI